MFVIILLMRFNVFHGKSDLERISKFLLLKEEEPFSANLITMSKPVTEQNWKFFFDPLY